MYTELLYGVLGLLQWLGLLPASSASPVHLTASCLSACSCNTRLGSFEFQSQHLRHVSRSAIPSPPAIPCHHGRQWSHRCSPKPSTYGHQRQGRCFYHWVLGISSSIRRIIPNRRHGSRFRATGQGWRRKLCHHSSQVQRRPAQRSSDSVSTHCRNLSLRTSLGLLTRDCKVRCLHLWPSSDLGPGWATKGLHTGRKGWSHLCGRHCRPQQRRSFDTVPRQQGDDSPPDTYCWRADSTTHRAVQGPLSEVKHWWRPCIRTGERVLVLGFRAFVARRLQTKVNQRDDLAHRAPKVTRATIFASRTP